jgi:hypothetical protein
MRGDARRRVAIVGAGPVGVEAALGAVAAGHDVRVYERGDVGHNVRRWGHVRMFSPWDIDRSPAGLAALAVAGVPLAAGAACPTGREYVEAYLEPLARTPVLRGCILERHVVVAIGREGGRKGLPFGHERTSAPFRLLIESPQGERIEHADVVLDCSGTYGHTVWMGSGNVPALGERALAGRIDYTLRDVAGAERDRFAGKRVLLVGDGHSAATALEALVGLPGTRVVWVTRRGEPRPYPELDADPLPERKRLVRLANDLAAKMSPCVARRPGAAVERVAVGGSGFEVELSAAGVHETVTVDRILAHVGYRPDRSLYRELQIHECYASLGPMRLAATLLAAASSDCLEQPEASADVLANPEPDFFILGAKSYGMRSDFLIRTGFEQVGQALALVEAGHRREARRPATAGEEGSPADP